MTIRLEPADTVRSLPSRGAWIEIARRAAGEAGGLGRSPRGERGLKFCGHRQGRRQGRSLPSRGAWIEMPPHR